MKKRAVKKEEDIWNVPNSLTFIRVLITFITIYLIFAGYKLETIAVFFIVGMLTDALDGHIARKFNQKTEFGRKFDMVADRFLMIGVALAFIADTLLDGSLTRLHMLQIFLIMSREIISLPIAIVAIASGKIIPHVRTIGKATTFMQAVTFPMILLSISNPAFNIAIYFSLTTCLLGLISGMYYINDIIANASKKN